MQYVSVSLGACAAMIVLKIRHMINSIACTGTGTYNGVTNESIMKGNFLVVFCPSKTTCPEVEQTKIYKGEDK
jgi:hypothetical protein